MSATVPSDEATRRVNRVLAVLVVLVPAALTALFRPPVDLGLDGAQYLHIAHHVARGHGLSTSLSLYHQALYPLPQASSIYPVWPLVLGAAIRAVGLEHAGSFVPKGLYVLDTWLVYRVLDLASRRLVRAGTARRLPPGAAHFGAVLFALNPILFWSTSLPYSEGLAFLWIPLILLAVDRAANADTEGSALRFSAASGFLAALLYLTRFQAVLAPIAVALTLVATGGSRAGVRRAAAALGAAALPVAAEAWFILRLPHAKPAILLDFSSYRQVPELVPFDFYVKPRLLVDWITDRVGGVFVSFDPTDANSYYETFGVLAYAPVVAAVAAAATPRTSLARIDRAVRAPACTLPVAAVLLGAALLLPVHMAHEKHFWPWLFGYRHGLPYGLIALPGLAVLIGSRRTVLRAAGLAIGLVAALQGAWKIRAHVASKPTSASALAESAAFLAGHPGSSAVAVEPQSLSVHTDSGIYWVACWSPPDFLPTLIEHIPVQYLLLRPHEASCDAFSEIKPRLTLVEVLAGGKMLAYRLPSTRAYRP